MNAYVNIPSATFMTREVERREDDLRFVITLVPIEANVQQEAS